MPNSLLFPIVIILSFFSAELSAGAELPVASSSVPERATTIYAAGDIAKCDGEDPWLEESLELVGYLPENSGKDKDEVEEQPFLEELLELVGWSEEIDHYASAEETAALLHGLPGPILALGDLGYPIGSPKSFNECYERTWGPLKERTYPGARQS